MTEQAKLKAQAYKSDLKSRALSVLIYLIDRSNKELTCFPSISTMAEQLHISVSTVKRALRELVAEGYLEKDSRFRNNKGQTSNLYTLRFKAEAQPEIVVEKDEKITDKSAKEIKIEKEIDNEIRYITFEMLKKETRNLEGIENKTPNLTCTEIASNQQKLFVINMSASILILFRNRISKILNQLWPGEEVILIPP